MTTTQVLPSIQELIDQGAIFYASHSGGADSQAMYAKLRKTVPHHQLVVVHAHLAEVEWPGVIEHIADNIDQELNVVEAVKRDGSKKTLLGMVEDRGMWPSSSCRQCTSDLKRNPIMKFIRRDLKERGARIAVNCTGIRAAESTARSKKNPFQYNVQESCGHRDVWDWMPIFRWSKKQVFNKIREAGQEPFWAYKENERLSCVFCIMGSVNDLRHGARQNPGLYKRYVELERKIGHTMFMRGKEPVPLEEHVGLKVSEVLEGS